MTYAQHGDDIILVDVFRSLGIERPSYLDIGAGHPFSCSNTAMFYERGSRGINVEPHPQRIKLLIEKRPEDTNVGVGVGVERGKATLYCVDANPDLSSFIQPLAEKHGACTPIEVKVCTIAEILIHTSGVFPDLLSIDIEGMDYAVLDQAINYDINNTNRPKVICVETVHCGDDQTTKFINLLEARGYRLHACAGANAIFRKV